MPPVLVTLLAAGGAPHLGLHHVGPLVADVLQGGRDINLLRSFAHPVEDHVDQTVGPGAAHTVTGERRNRR